jgi:hypothetical protein
VPGFSGSHVSEYRRPAAKSLHQIRTAAIRKETTAASEAAAIAAEKQKVSRIHREQRSKYIVLTYRAFSSLLHPPPPPLPPADPLPGLWFIMYQTSLPGAHRDEFRGGSCILVGWCHVLVQKMVIPAFIRTVIHSESQSVIYSLTHSLIHLSIHSYSGLP